MYLGGNATLDFQTLIPLVIPGETKIAMIVMDGLGGLPIEPGGKTELESARKPNLDALAAQSILGLADPVAPGITPGSGPGHLGIFGYDPLKFEIGRGVLEALGIDFELGANDVAARGNFCTIDAEGKLIDRRAGRIPTELNAELTKILRTIKLPGVELFVETVKDYRFVFVLRGKGLGDGLTETDPQRVGVAPLPVKALNAKSRKSAKLANAFIAQARKLIGAKKPANMIMLRGFAKRPAIPTFRDVYGMRAAAIAVYSMYRGLARTLGMNVLKVDGETIADEFTTLEKNWRAFDFFYLHVKKTDSSGEDGDFLKKARVIEELDEQLPRLMALQPDVVIVGSDHSTPAILKAHSWHPVPVMLYSRYCRADGIAEYGERACARGSLGRVRSKEIMPIALANALRTTKFGA
ncbi:MAG: 2,3-bisphosphoglycerate-independent phosphoglycerate mutase [Chloroflexi bacterium]|nr:2,3-bisphosphoglycerate-independent phosphoglycerate mutase [Chloroflexota bacterium]